MKKIITTFCALLLVVAFKASAQKEQTRQVSGFTGISNTGSFTVKVKIDGSESVKVVANDDQLEKIETVVEGGTLRIGTKNNKGSWWGGNGVKGNVTVYVSAKMLSNLHNTGSGDITLDGNLTGSDPQIHNTGSGDVKLVGNMNGDKAAIHNTGSGNVKVDGTVATTNVDIHVTGSGNLTTGLKASDLSANLSGSGNITLSGTATTATLTVSSSGQMNGRTLHAGTVTARVTGSGNIHIGVDKTINAHITGSGNIVYNGSGNISEIKTSGSGSIRRGNEE